MGGRGVFLSIVLVNRACVRLGVCEGEGSSPPVFELMRCLAYGGSLSSVGYNFREVRIRPCKGCCAVPRCTELYNTPLPPLRPECFCMELVKLLEPLC